MAAPLVSITTQIKIPKSPTSMPQSATYTSRSVLATVAIHSFAISNYASVAIDLINDAFGSYPAVIVCQTRLFSLPKAVSAREHVFYYLSSLKRISIRSTRKLFGGSRRRRR
jgi:hypothetical protein